MGNIVLVAEAVGEMEDETGYQFRVTSWLRPEIYNTLVGGSKNSWHMRGGAMDVQPTNPIPCDQIRSICRPLLSKCGLRMEKKKGSSWVHFDIGHVIGKERYFIP